MRAAEDLSAIIDGALVERPFAVRLWDGSELPSTGPDPAATLVVRSPRALEYLAREPNQLGLGRAWVSGELELDGDIERALSAADMFGHQRRVRRSQRLRALRAARRLGALRVRSPAPPSCEARVDGAGRRHSTRRDRVAVRHHYDVPVEFYRLLLGPSMVYSCAVFAAPGESLESAQERKLEMICAKLDLRPGERMLDVGCGWGSLVMHAAAHHGARAVGITLSEAQAQEARRRIAGAGLEDRCEVRVQDYREVDDGPYDKLSSVGMYEHVGREMLATYVRRLRGLVRPGGRVLNHGIARITEPPADDKSFIRRYVFPDGELHPVSALIGLMQQTGFELRHVESLREHYPPTLRRWLANLDAARDDAIAFAGAERERVWRLYMAGSALAFERGEIGVFQTLALRR